MFPLIERETHMIPQETETTMIWDYSIHNDMVESYFELNLPPILGLHPIFIVELL